MEVDSKAESTNTVRRSRAPRKSVELGSTMADNGISVGGAQEATTRSHSAPKARVGAPNQAVL